MLIPETLSADLRRLASGRDFHGYLTLENLDAVADRLRALIGNGQRYTWVACNEGMRDYRPEVRTGQVAKKVWVDRRDTDGKTRGVVGVADTWGAWWINTDAPDREAARQCDAGHELAYVEITYGQFRMEHRAPAGYRLYWVVAVERGE